MPAGDYWSLHCDSVGVCDRLCGQPVAGMERVGLQQPAGQYPGSGMSAILPALDAGKPGWNRAG